MKLVPTGKEATFFLNSKEAGAAADAYFREEGRSMTPAHAVVLQLVGWPTEHFPAGVLTLVEVRHQGRFAGYLQAYEPGAWRGGARECRKSNADGKCECEGAQCYLRDAGDR